MTLYPHPLLFPSPSLYPTAETPDVPIQSRPTPTWYLGTIGDMRALPCPEVGVQINPVRYGGIHQGLSGARIVDITGFRTDYDIEFTYLDPDEFRWLEAIYMQAVPGPHYLINPLKPNLLSAQSSSMLSGQLGVTVGGTTATVADYPSDLSFPVRSTKMVDWIGSSNLMLFDNSRPVPLVNGQPLVFSIYLKADAALTTTLKAYWYSATGSLITSTDTTIGVDTEWSRPWMAYLEPPSGAVAMTPGVSFGTAGADIYVTAPQLESGVGSPTAFGLGGGAASVVISEFPVSSPRFPLRDVTVKLLET